MAGHSAQDTFCPECFMELAPGAVICTNCGYNVKTGATIDTVVEGSSPSTAMKRSKPVGILPRAELRKTKQKTKILIGIPANYEEAGKLVWRAIIAGGVCGIVALVFVLAEVAGYVRADWLTAVIILGLTAGVFLKNRACAAALLLYVVFVCIRDAYTDPASRVPCLIGLVVFPKFLWDGVRGATTFERADSSLIRSAITTVAVLVLIVGTAGSYVMGSAHTAIADDSIQRKTKQIAELEATYNYYKEAGFSEEMLREVRAEITYLEQEIEQIKEKNKR